MGYQGKMKRVWMIILFCFSGLISCVSLSVTDEGQSDEMEFDNIKNDEIFDHVRVAMGEDWEEFATENLATDKQKEYFLFVMKFNMQDEGIPILSQSKKGWRDLAVIFEVTGDGSLGALQDPIASKLTPSRSAAPLYPDSERSNYTHSDGGLRIAGKLIYSFRNMRTSPTVSFAFGSGGYSVVTIATPPKEADETRESGQQAS